MSQQNKKIVILRGPSGSGKSTIAKMIADQTGGVAVIEQDRLTEDVFNHQDGFKEATRDAIKALVDASLAHGFVVLLDGILNTAYYEEYFSELLEKHEGSVLFVYVGVSFETTLQRHAERDKAKLFGKEEMANWFAKSQALGTSGELLIGEDVSANQAADKIIKAAGW